MIGVRTPLETCPEAKEVLDDDDEDVGEVVRQSAGRLLGLGSPSTFIKDLGRKSKSNQEHLDAKGSEEEHIEAT